eukprot:TRINITY_DN3565_c0_g1_i1.p1 TRINITY_DN3565_c0_g1~~TRINITY_DN3565_c0_g1_i1.p1  ORF type:complete len:377 (-),score=63.26 TRINITY_DN3565_c0_g1_i1:11-1048(-)
MVAFAGTVALLGSLAYNVYQKSRPGRSAWRAHRHKFPHVKDDSFTAEEAELLDLVVEPDSITTGMDDIGGLKEVKESIFETVIMPVKRPSLFSSTLLAPFSGVLLFGPPGTGKTLLARAIAKECGAVFINVELSTLKQKWYGESESRVAALFSLAHKLQPTIIFIDEIDALLSHRSDLTDNEVNLSVKAGILTAWEGVTKDKDSRVIVVAATNRPTALDPAVMRRMPRKFCVGLPDLAARKQILDIYVARETAANNRGGGQALDASQVNTEVVARLTDGFSGSDLFNLLKIAALRPVREFLVAEKEFLAGKRAEAVLRPLNTGDLVDSIPSVTTQDQNRDLGVFV